MLIINFIATRQVFLPNEVFSRLIFDLNLTQKTHTHTHSKTILKSLKNDTLESLSVHQKCLIIYIHM